MAGPLAVVAAWSLAAVSVSAAAPAAPPAPLALREAAAAAGVPWDAALQAASAPAEPASAPASVVPDGLWASLEAPAPAYLAWLSQRVTGLDASAVRTLTESAADGMLAAASAAGQTPLDFFTDAGFRGRETYFVPQALAGRIFSTWDLRVFTPFSGVAEDGSPFQMQGFLLGGGRLEILYDRAEFTFLNPELENGKYTLLARVTERIAGPGALEIDGVWYHYGVLKPRIKRIVKISPTQGRVETNYGDKVKPALPIRRRS